MSEHLDGFDQLKHIVRYCPDRKHFVITSFACILIIQHTTDNLKDFPLLIRPTMHTPLSPPTECGGKREDLLPLHILSGEG